jgi:hypothetical protein
LLPRRLFGNPSLTIGHRLFIVRTDIRSQSSEPVRSSKRVLVARYDFPTRTWLRDYSSFLLPDDCTVGMNCCIVHVKSKVFIFGSCQRDVPTIDKVTLCWVSDDDLASFSRIHPPPFTHVAWQSRQCWRSRDLGRTWELSQPGKNLGQFVLFDNALFALEYSSFSPYVIVGLVKSLDNGETWVADPTLTDTPQQLVLDHTFDRLLCYCKSGSLYQLTSGSGWRTMTDLGHGRREPIAAVVRGEIYASRQVAPLVFKICVSTPNLTRIRRHAALLSRGLASRGLPDDVINCHVFPYLFPLPFLHLL